MPRTPFSQSDLATLLGSPAWVRCEQIIRQFEQAWRVGPDPVIGDYLRVEGRERRALLVELIHIDLEFRIKSGQAARVESYLSEHPDLAADRTITLDLLTAEFDFRRRHQGTVSTDEYGERFPDHHDDFLARISGLGRSGPSVPAGPTAWPAVPGYEVVAELGRGGMGVIYKALEPSLGRHVALKFLPEEYGHDPDRLDRFLREARTASALNHPHICTVHALGEHNRRPFIVMELIEGETLQAISERRPKLTEIARLLHQATQALVVAHAAGVVHRDVKPENVMVRSDGYVKVLDFGLARRLPTLTRQPGAANDTEPGAVMGTVAYMSPEQARGEPAERASDIFSLGIVLYQLATGQHPFEAGSALSTLYAVANREPPPPSRLNPELPASLDGLLASMLHKDARLRPTTAEVESALAALMVTRAAAAPVSVARPTVRREPELRALHAALAEADAGRGSLVCVTGEAGIGKTTLVEDFLREVESPEAERVVARGHCSERLAGSEAYLPVLEALSGLLRGNADGWMGRVMQVVAPTWHWQIAPASEGSGILGRASSQQAMLREFGALVQEVSRRNTLVLFFDDIHWADASTVDLLAHLGRVCGSLRVLVLLTHRLSEMLQGPHPFHRVKLDLQARGTCADLPLGFLGRADIDRYLDLAFPGHGLPADFVDLIYARTEGSPLFMADLLRHLRERGVIAEVAGRWSLAREVPDLRQDLPGSVRGMILRELDRLSEADRRLLSGASVQGHEFDSVIVAGAIGRDVVEVEERLQVLERVNGLVRLVREYELADRTLTQRYAFVHVLYQQALASDLPPSRRTILALSLARGLQSHIGEGAMAAELACLFEVGRAFTEAARQFGLAAENAGRVFAHREALLLARRGLSLLEGMPDNAERASLELPLQTALGLQLQVTEGFAAPAAQQAYSRARQLCIQMGQTPTTLFPVLWGLWLFAKVRSELPRARLLAEELQSLAQRSSAPALTLQSHQALAVTTLCLGEPAATLRHMEQATALYDPARHRMHSSRYGQDPGVACKAFGAVALWLLGFPDTAARQSGEAIRLAEHLAQPSSLALALMFASMLHQLRRDGVEARRCASMCRAIAAEHGFSFWLAGAEAMEGWAMAACGDVTGGTALLRQGLSDWSATGSVTYRTYFLGLLAEVLVMQGATAEARRVLTEALDLAQRTGEGLVAAELHRLDGETGAAEDAETHFRRAIDVARLQGAKSLELRAAMSLARRGKREALAEVVAGFTEGLDTPDVREAKALLK